MSKGGDDQQTVSQTEPWKPLQQPLLALTSQAQRLSQQSPQFYPGQTFVGALPTELQSFQRQLGYADSVFGGTPSPDYGAMVGANSSLLQGGPNAGLFAGIAPTAQSALLEQFGGPNLRIGSGYGQGVTAPVTSGVDPSAAITRMLSGTPDYSGVEAATRAYADPMLDMLNEDLLPGLMSRGVSLNNETGETKELNRIVPRVMRDIGNRGAQLAEAERIRALNDQAQGAGLALSQTGQQLQGYGLGLQGRQLDLSGDIAQQSALDRYRGDTLSLLGATGNLGGQAASSMGAGVSAFPTTFGLGMTPGQILGDYGQFQRGLSEAELQDSMRRFNYGQNQPRADAEWLLNMLRGVGGGSGSGTATQSGGQNNDLLSLLGLATTVGSFFFPPLALAAPAIGAAGAYGGTGAGMGTIPTSGGGRYV